MDIWIIRNGEKVGPIRDYEARRKIESGELTRDTPAWHEGLDAWRPLCEIAIFKDDLTWIEHDAAESATAHDAEEADVPGAAPPPLPAGPVLWRRFWARWLDLHVYVAIWWLCMWATGRPIEAVLSNLWIMVVQFVPWFIVESILIHHFATTPGKWLLGLRVTNTDGTRLSLAAATLRSFRVLVGGVGFGFSLLALFCQTLSYFTAKRLGNALWDQAGGHRVHSRPLVAWRIIMVVCVFLAALQLQMAVIAPYVLKSAVEAFPFLKEELEKNPPWHLPPRSGPR